MGTLRAAGSFGAFSPLPLPEEGSVDPYSRYELLEKLGKGSYGTVYKVFVFALGREGGARGARAVPRRKRSSSSGATNIMPPTT